LLGTTVVTARSLLVRSTLASGKMDSNNDG